MKLSQLAQQIGAQLLDAASGDQDIQRLAPIEKAGPQELSFVASAEYEKFLAGTTAGAVILAKPHVACRVPQLIHTNPYLAYAKAAQLFYAPRHDFSGVSDRAFIHPTARLGQGVTVYPFAYVGPQATIGDAAVIYPGCYVGEGVEIGARTVLYANVVLQQQVRVGARVIVHAGTVIGADGFGFAVGDGEIVKIPQVGTVVIGDDVEIGAVCTIDRAAMDKTAIGEHSKLDSKVHVGHNVQIGHHTMLSALTGLAGSARIGNWVLMGGHSGASNNVVVADRSKIGTMAGVIRDTEAGGTYMGFPAQPANDWRRQVVAAGKLPGLLTEMRQLRQRLSELESRLNPSEQ
jgi:UDP-3-O-[3-hydroxymyristoyl] glucosamine N-acyltransferase